VEIYFGNISIEVNSAGHDLFQQVSNGIKAGDQRVNGKQIREATSFLANVSFDLERKLETFPEGDVNITPRETCELGLNEPHSEKELEVNASKKKRNQALLGLTARDWGSF
jgi:hypothetical protein